MFNEHIKNERLLSNYEKDESLDSEEDEVLDDEDLEIDINTGEEIEEEYD